MGRPNEYNVDAARPRTRAALRCDSALRRSGAPLPPALSRRSPSSSWPTGRWCRCSSTPTWRVALATHHAARVRALCAAAPDACLTRNAGEVSGVQGGGRLVRGARQARAQGAGERHGGAALAPHGHVRKVRCCEGCARGAMRAACSHCLPVLSRSRAGAARAAFSYTCRTTMSTTSAPGRRGTHCLLRADARLRCACAEAAHDTHPPSRPHAGLRFAAHADARAVRVLRPGRGHNRFHRPRAGAAADGGLPGPGTRI